MNDLIGIYKEALRSTDSPNDERELRRIAKREVKKLEKYITSLDDEPIKVADLPVCPCCNEPMECFDEDSEQHYCWVCGHVEGEEE